MARTPSPSGHGWRIIPTQGPGGLHRMSCTSRLRNSRLGSRALSMPGSGVLRTGHRLTAPGANLSTWRVPDWLNPRQGGSGMTYHPPHRWGPEGTVRSAPRGQEFVAVPANDGRAIEWLTALLGEILE